MESAHVFTGADGNMNAVHAPPDVKRRMAVEQQLIDTHSVGAKEVRAGAEMSGYIVAGDAAALAVANLVLTKTFRTAVPRRSPAWRYTRNAIVCKVCTPVPALCVAYFGYAMVQLPYDYRVWAQRGADLAEHEAQLALALQRKRTLFAPYDTVVKKQDPLS
jgi:hypothetical protein